MLFSHLIPLKEVKSNEVNSFRRLDGKEKKKETRPDDETRSLKDLSNS